MNTSGTVRNEPINLRRGRRLTAVAPDGGRTAKESTRHNCERPPRVSRNSCVPGMAQD